MKIGPQVERVLQLKIRRIEVAGKNIDRVRIGLRVQRVLKEITGNGLRIGRILKKIMKTGAEVGNASRIAIVQISVEE